MTVDQQSLDAALAWVDRMKSGEDPHVSYEPWIVALADAYREKQSEVRTLCEALRTADAEASLAHDAIWSVGVRDSIAGTGIDVLHSNDREDSAQSAIWRLHEVVRAAIATVEAHG